MSSTARTPTACKVVLTVTMMAWDSASANRQAKLLGSSVARSRLVNQIVTAMRSRGADGVNLDFEPLATSLRDEYVSFVRQLKRALVNHGVGDYLTVCVMAGAATWATGYDVAGLTASGAADGLFVMGYDFHWSGSSRAGGVAPMQSPYTLDVAGAMADFLNETSAVEADLGRAVLRPHLADQQRRAERHHARRRIEVVRLHRPPGARRRSSAVAGTTSARCRGIAYWDNAGRPLGAGLLRRRRLAGAKYDLINARGLAGTGMWTLLMDQGRDELWRLLANKFVHDTAPPVGGVQTMPATTDAEALIGPLAGAGLRLGRSQLHGPVPPRPWRWRTWLAGSRKTSAWFAGEAGSTYEFRVRAVDLKGNAQSWITVPGKPVSLKAGAFARVSAATLNIRSGPGTQYGIVDGAVAGDVVYVLEGPVAAGGYQWYRVQYGFS